MNINNFPKNFTTFRSHTIQNEHVAKLNEIFSQANRVTRRDKALILGFMGGCRENPMPSPENYIVIKLGETEVCVLTFSY